MIVLTKCRDCEPKISLHDSSIESIEIKENGVLFLFDEIFDFSNEVTKSVKGSIFFENLDPEDCAVYLYKVNQASGVFRGKKYSLRSFVNSFENFSIEIVTETYNSFDISWQGCLFAKDDMYEVLITIWTMDRMEYNLSI